MHSLASYKTTAFATQLGFLWYTGVAGKTACGNLCSAAVELEEWLRLLCSSVSETPPLSTDLGVKNASKWASMLIGLHTAFMPCRQNRYGAAPIAETIKQSKLSWWFYNGDVVFLYG